MTIFLIFFKISRYFNPVFKNFLIDNKVLPLYAPPKLTGDLLPGENVSLLF